MLIVAYIDMYGRQPWTCKLQLRANYVTIIVISNVWISGLMNQPTITVSNTV